MFTAKIREKSNRTAKPLRLLFIILVAALALILGAATPQVWAEDPEFEEGEIFFELNNTDEDLGIHGLIDGGPWKHVWIKDKYHRTMLNVLTRGRLRHQALTEFAFESAEPVFDDLDPADFFARFKKGKYTIYGRSKDGVIFSTTTELTHVMPAPPDATVNGVDMAEQCDDEEPGYDAPVVSNPVTIEWPAVTMSHPDADGGGASVQPPVPVTIVNYEVVVEVDLEVDGEDFTSVFSVILPPDQTSWTIPQQFLDLGDKFKYEVLAREESFNQTATESCFED